MPKHASTKSRGAVTKDESHLVTVWVPIPVVAGIDAAVKRRDTDRSKWIREAIREKAEREGQPI
ncbi:ribbon-helix-helix protein, CopG family [Luteolibacter marinus]|uniref:ribbon-helix-helix protein, CopG family n=1 Tax=Luteolibacter marinus TaxID=2776705 RepID=UPI001868B6AB|nr:ribbon-helix-helix protein, CopG family [Luteolibacter marinus]